MLAKVAAIHAKAKEYGDLQFELKGLREEEEALSIKMEDVGIIQIEGVHKAPTTLFPDEIKDGISSRYVNVMLDADRAERALAVHQSGGNGMDARVSLLGPPQTAALKFVEQWADEKEEPGILLHGAHGTGKSFAAREYLCSHDQKFCVESTTSLSPLGNFNPEERKFWSHLRYVPILVLDDLGKEFANRVWKENLFSILESRMTSGVKTLITTNLSPHELHEKYGPEIFERLVALCRFVAVRSCVEAERHEVPVNKGNLRAATRKSGGSEMSA